MGCAADRRKGHDPLGSCCPEPNHWTRFAALLPSAKQGFYSFVDADVFACRQIFLKSLSFTGGCVITSVIAAYAAITIVVLPRRKSCCLLLRWLMRSVLEGIADTFVKSIAVMQKGNTKRIEKIVQFVGDSSAFSSTFQLLIIYIIDCLFILCRMGRAL